MSDLQTEIPIKRSAQGMWSLVQFFGTGILLLMSLILAACGEWGSFAFVAVVGKLVYFFSAWRIRKIEKVCREGLDLIEKERELIIFEKSLDNTSRGWYKGG